MVKVKKKTVKRALKAADKRLKQILEIKLPDMVIPPRDPRLGAPRPVFGPSLLAHERRYKIKVEEMASIGKWADDVNESYHRRLKWELDAFIGDLRHWWSL